MDIPASEVCVRALWFVEPTLVDRTTKDLVDPRTKVRDWNATLRMRMGSCAPDERAAVTAVDRFLSIPESLLKHIQFLCDFMFDWHQGLPNLRANLLVRRLARLVDPDSLLCLAGLDCTANDGLDWGAVPFRNHGLAASAIEHESFDSHVHLGGILAPLFFWIAVVGGQFPLEALEALPNILRRHASGEEWQYAAASHAFAHAARDAVAEFFDSNRQASLSAFARSRSGVGNVFRS